MERAIKYPKAIFLFLLLALLYMQCGKGSKAVINTPALDGVQPASGIIGDPVTVSGRNLQNADRITFNGVASNIVQSTASSITTVVPPGVSPGINKIAAHTSGGGSNELQFEVIKTPDHIDDGPPTLSKAIPGANYTEYPVLIYGDNLSGVVSITFNNKAAVIFTNNKKVITTTVPEGIGAGTVKIAVKTVKGTSTLDFQVKGPPPAGPASVNFSIISIPPPNYVPVISNNWTCGLFSATTGNNFVDLNKKDSNNNLIISGSYEYRFDKAAGYNALNYVEFTNKETGEVFAGQFSATTDTPCILKMVLISSLSGEVTTCTFDRSEFGNCDP